MLRPGPLLLATGLLWLSEPAPAADGVLEINQACATGSGCFPGDSAGFPVEIAASGSYRLTGSLAVPALLGGVSVSANDVTLDLGGFEIAGAIACTGEGASLSCPGWFAAGTSGIFSGADNVVVRDGSVRGFSSGLRLVGGVFSLEGLRIAGNGGVGVWSGIPYPSVIADSIVERNGGVDPSSPAAARRGAEVVEALILRSTFRANGGAGVWALGPTLALENSFVTNAREGFLCSGVPPCVVTGSAVQENGTAGLATSPLSRLVFGENVIRDNPVAVTGGGTEIEMGINVCDTDTTCP